MIKDKEEAFAEIDRLRALVAEMLGALEAVLEEYAAWTVDRPVITANTMLMVRDVIAKAKGE